MHVAYAFAPLMAEARRGTFLFLSSVAGQIGSQTDPPYSASKAGLINFAQCAAKDLAPFGVRVNTLCPGMVKTTLNRSVLKHGPHDRPRRRLLRTTNGPPRKSPSWCPRPLAGTGRYRGDGRLSRVTRAGNVTGQTINVDGGYVMHW